MRTPCKVEILQGNDKPIKPSSLEELLASCPKNKVIGDNLIRAWSKINSPKYKKIVCAISGGSDSDDMMDWSK